MGDLSQTREEIKRLPLARVPVELPEWEGRTLYVRKLKAAERIQLEDRLASLKGEDRTENGIELVASVAAVCTVDEAGERVFDLEDVAWLKDADWDAVFRLFKAGSALNKLTAGEVEGLEKNSGNGQA